LDGKAVLGRDPEKLAGDQEGEEAFSVKVRYADIDVNRHVNSSRYIDWIMDAYPLEFHRRNLLRVLEINFLSETLEDEVLSVRTRQTGAGAYAHSLRKADRSEICRARLEWEETPCKDLEKSPVNHE
jgi:acyl-ACP thioesterase